MLASSELILEKFCQEVPEEATCMHGVRIRQIKKGLILLQRNKKSYPFLTSSNRLLQYVAIPWLLIHSRKHLSSLEVCTSSVIISAKEILLLSADRPFLHERLIVLSQTPTLTIKQAPKINVNRNDSFNNNHKKYPMRTVWKICWHRWTTSQEKLLWICTTSLLKKRWMHQ